MLASYAKCIRGAGKFALDRPSVVARAAYRDRVEMRRKSDQRARKQEK
jgi:hypothetical protein